MITFYIVRHGETEWNASHKIQGHTDIALTEQGISQARQVADELRHVSFDEAFSSDLVRAKRTAEIIALERKLEIRTTQALRERHFGSFQGKSGDDYRALWQEWQHLSDEERWNHKVADEETSANMMTRFMNFLRETAIAYPNKTILIATHNGIMSSFLVKIGHGTWGTIKGFDNCGYMIVTSDGLTFDLQETKGLKVLENS